MRQAEFTYYLIQKNQRQADPERIAACLFFCRRGLKKSFLEPIDLIVDFNDIFQSGGSDAAPRHGLREKLTAAREPG